MNEKEERLYELMIGDLEKAKIIHKTFKKMFKSLVSYWNEEIVDEDDKEGKLIYKMKQRNGNYLGEHEVKIHIYNSVFKGKALCHSSEETFHPIIGVVLAEYRLYNKLKEADWL